MPVVANQSTRTVVIGGGLAGLAAAVALVEHGLTVDLFEARRHLGGRAASFRDPATDEVVDHCQHVSMACCTNLANFCRRTGIGGQFARVRNVPFFTSDGRRFDFAATRWLPAPLHLAPALLSLGYLSWPDRLKIAWLLVKLARWRPAPGETPPTVAAWLRIGGQRPTAIAGFWRVVLDSALGESVERASLVDARKVFVDGFMRHRSAYEIEVPRVPLGQLYGTNLEAWLTARGVRVHLGAAVERVEGDKRAAHAIVLTDGARHECDAVVAALPWRHIAKLFADSPLAASLPQLKLAEQIHSSPITAVHLWFDRPIMAIEQAVLVGTLSQWVFHHPWAGAGAEGHYYQVVISASHELAGRARDDIVAQVAGELRRVWPAARESRLLHARVVTDPHAVFSARPGSDALRPEQRTALGNLALAGDWTATGWPATMEGAVRSGYLAAEAILAHFGQQRRVVVDDLPAARLSRWLGLVD